MSETELPFNIVKSKCGDRTLKIANRSIHSPRDPQRDATAQANRLIGKMKEEGWDVLVLLGTGLGYLPKALSDAGVENVIVWEPFPKLMHKLGQMKIPCPFPLAESFVELQVLCKRKMGQGSRPLLVMHPGYGVYCRMEELQVLRWLKAYTGRDIPLDVKSSIISERSLDSLIRLPFLPSVDVFKNKYEGRKALLLSPGPSLKASLPALKRKKGEVIFAAIQAVPMLYKEGIEVDFAVSPDPANPHRFMEGGTDTFKALLMESAVDPTLLDRCKDKAFTFHYKTNHLTQIYWDANEGSSFDEPIATVSETMLLLALEMGFKEFTFIGMDFAWRDENRYSYRGKSMSDSMGDKFELRFPLKLRDGKMGETSAAYFHAWRYMCYKCELLKKEGFKLDQYTEALAIPSATQLSEKELFLGIGAEGEGVEIEIPKVRDERKIAEVEALLDAASQMREVNGVDSESGKPESHKMPFFYELSPESREEIIGYYKEQLKEKANP